MGIVVSYVICCFASFPCVCEVVLSMGFMARPGGRGHFVLRRKFVFCVEMELCVEVESWVVLKVFVRIGCT